MGPGSTMGFVLWTTDGRPDCLEGFQNGDEAEATLDLRTRDLGALRARHIVVEAIPSA